jgi:hypothetical protein
MEQEIVRLKDLVAQQKQTISELQQRNRKIQNGFNQQLALTLNQLTEEKSKYDTMYRLMHQTDDELEELQLKYTKLEAKVFEQEKDSGHLKEEINNIKKDNEIKEKLIICFKERVRKSGLNILIQTLKTIRYKMTVKRQLCMLLKMKTAGERKKVVDSKKIAEDAERIAVLATKKQSDLQKENDFKTIFIDELKIKFKQFKLTVLTKTLIAIRLKANFKRQVFMLCKIMLLRRRRMMKAAGEKKEKIEKPDDHTDLLKNILSCVATMKIEQDTLINKTLLENHRLETKVEELKEENYDLFAKLDAKVQKQAEQNLNVELANRNFKLQIDDKLNETEKKLQNFEQVLQHTAVDKLNETEKKLQNFEQVLQQTAVEKKQKEQRKQNDSIKTDEENKKKEATKSNKKQRGDVKTEIEESNKKVKELDNAMLETKEQLKEIGAKLIILGKKEKKVKKYNGQNEKLVETVFFKKNDTTKYGSYTIIPQTNLRDKNVYSTITSLLNSIENTLKDSLKNHSGVTISPEQIHTAWDLHLENSRFKEYKEEWKGKSYLSPIFKKPYNCNMTQNEWDWQTNTNRILISPG